MRSGRSRRRVVRGLALGFALSLLNLVAAFLAIDLLGGFGSWTRWQFLGVFGLIETATGIAYFFAPNIWHLPVAEAATSERTPIHLAASTILLPHWAAGAKTAAGALMLAFAVTREGIGPASAGILPFILLVVVAVLGLSLVLARLGVARPDLDVVYLVVRRPHRREWALPGISLGAAVVQLLTNIGAYPLVKFLPPSLFYQPEIGPSASLLALLAGLAAVLVGAAYLAWRGRIRWRAAREQQREAEEFV